MREWAFWFMGLLAGLGLGEFLRALALLWKGSMSEDIPERQPIYRGDSEEQAGWAVLDPEKTAAANAANPTKLNAVYRYEWFPE